MQFSENLSESDQFKSIKTRIKATIALAILSVAPLAISLIFTGQADAFEPWRSGKSQFLFGKGEARPNDTSHESITEDAVKAFARDSLSCPPSEAAIQEIVTANGFTDLWEVRSSSAHFDCEDFSGGQKRLKEKIADIIASLNAGKIPKAREALGQALHAVQDFYSHSNWVETRGGIYEDLGRAGRLTVASGATCLACPSASGCENNLILPVQWTSGYFSAFVFTGCNKPAGKCSHGGSLDRTAKDPPKGGINKDTSNSPHGALHHSAAAAAVLASKRFLTNLQTDHHVTVEQLKKLLCGPTLAISIDTTAGMRPIIEAVKNSAITIVNNRLGTDEEPAEYVLAPFNDPEVPDPIVTSDPNIFKRAISGLSASGGGGPELAMTGAFKAVSAASSSGDLFLFTDDNAKDASRETAVRDLAANKKIRVFPSVFPNDPKSGRHTPSATAATVSHWVDPSYQEVAEGTAGQVFSLDASEAGQIMTLLDDVSRSNAVNLLSIQDTLGPTPSVYHVPIDNTLSAVTFSVSGDTSVTLTRPDGSVVQAGDPGVTIVSLSSAHLFSIASPPTGFWQISVSGSGAFSITVTGEATLDVKSFDFVQDLTAQAHEPGLFPIDGFPVALQTNIVSGELTDAFDFAQFEFRSPAGGILQVLDLQRGTGTANTVFVGSVIPPSTPFLVYATGRTAAGVRFQRLLPGTITPQSVTIAAPAPADLVPGTLTTYTFRVHNLGSADRFNFTAFDDKGFLAGITPASFWLSYDETKEVTVTLRTPRGAGIGTSDTLTVNVTSNRGGDRGSRPREDLFNTRNFAVVVSDVARPGTESDD